MKFKYYSFLASAVLMLAAACTPDDHDLSAPELTADDLVEGKAYKVEIDQATKIPVTYAFKRKFAGTLGHDVLLCDGYVAEPCAVTGVIDINGEGINSDANFKPSYNDWREYTGYTVKKYSPLAFRR